MKNTKFLVCSSVTVIFREFEVLLHWQGPTNEPYSKPVKSNLHPPTIFVQIHVSILSLYLCLPSGLFPTSFLTKLLYKFLILCIHATHPVHLLFTGLVTVKYLESTNYEAFTMQISLSSCNLVSQAQIFFSDNGFSGTFNYTFGPETKFNKNRKNYSSENIFIITGFYKGDRKAEGFVPKNIRS
jgi:hypothetical protein